MQPAGKELTKAEYSADCVGRLSGSTRWRRLAISRFFWDAATTRP